ncbi:MAG: Diphthine synthase [Methanoregula sp. PtaU1.Bin051]|nr:MAG: Diphthine synthase [Methanoregula sp. PtaU1.Bin051]
MLTFVGLGLYDDSDISVKGLACIAAADFVYLESYTSRLMGASVEDLERRYQKPVRLLFRKDVELHADTILKAAADSNVAFLVAGDPMVATTHVDLRIRAEERGISTSIIHGASIASAVCGLTGLQNYRFGKSCSLPFPQKNWFPITPMEVIVKNIAQNLHTLVYLDIREERFMTIPEAIDLLETLAGKMQAAIPLYVGVARAGSEMPVVAAGMADKIREIDFGPPLHIIAVPGELHEMERRYLELFAGL